MSQMEFRLPAETLVPLPGSAPAPRPRPTAAAVPSDPFDAFGSPPAVAAAARDDFAELEAIGAPQGQAAAGMCPPPSPPPRPSCPVPCLHTLPPAAQPCKGLYGTWICLLQWLCTCAAQSPKIRLVQPRLQPTIV